MAFKISRQGQISGIVTTIRYMLVLWIVLISNYKWSGIIITTMVTELGHTNCREVMVDNILKSLQTVYPSHSF